MSNIGITTEPVSLIDSAQNVTTGWVDLGPEIAVNGWGTAGLYVNVDINDALNFRFRAVAKHTGAHADEFVLPIKTVGASSVAIEDEYLELTDDADQKLLLSVSTGYVARFIQWQISAGTAGATAGQVDSAVSVLGSAG